MLSVFNIIRTSIYSAVIVWTLIVLGMAAHLDSILVSNEMTRFIPLAIFVSVLTFLIIPSLLAFGFIKRPFLVQQVRIEMAFVGVLGLLWFIVGLYTATEPEAEVECEFDNDGDYAPSDEFTTETFYAQYHTLEAFAIFNAILLLLVFFALLLLSLRQHRMGQSQVWTSAVTTYPWFGGSSSNPQVPPKHYGGLPPPVTAKMVSKSGKEHQTTTVEVNGGINGGAGGGDTPMKAGGHYIIYIPPPPPSRR